MDTIQAIVIPCLFIVSLIGTFAPYWLSPMGQDITRCQARFLSYGNCFAGGILFATAVIHMIPEQLESAEKLSLHSPIPQLFVILGFFLLLIIQYSGLLTKLRLCYEPKPKIPTETSAPAPTSLEEGHHTEVLVPASISNEESHHGEGSAASECQTVECPEIHYHHDHHDHHNIVINGTLPIFLAIMLSLHSALLGIALGAIDSEESLTSLYISIFPHQLFESFALGVCCRKGNVPFKKALIGLTAYSLVLPAFIIIGFLATLGTDGNTNLWLDVVFQGLSAGTFFFISILEIVSEELNRSKGNFWRFIALIIGAVAIIGLGFVGHDH